MHFFVLMKPKHQGKRRVILDLSYHKGFALNNQVIWFRFDGDLFSLRFPSMDDIFKEICSHKDIADMYIDVTVVLCWAHRRVSFQFICDAITFIMADAGVKMFSYLDNYIIVSPRVSCNADF